MKNPDAKPVTIINHPDVRRKLLWIKSHVEGSRSLCYFTAFCIDMAKVARTEEEKAKWEGFLDLLTPIVKAWTTDKGLLSCSMAMDVYGGYGYCSEYPVEQYLRDEKIATIYEGTNGIQALDLVGRKLGQRKGANVMNMAACSAEHCPRQKERGPGQIRRACSKRLLNACLELTLFFAQAGKSAISCCRF
jgi:hypothetical protein